MHPLWGRNFCSRGFSILCTWNSVFFVCVITIWFTNSLDHWPKTPWKLKWSPGTMSILGIILLQQVILFGYLIYWKGNERANRFQRQCFSALDADWMFLLRAIKLIVSSYHLWTELLNLFELGSSGMSSFERSPGDSNVHPGMRTTGIRPFYIIVAKQSKNWFTLSLRWEIVE